MSDQDDTTQGSTTSGGMPTPPVIEPGDAVFRRIMGKIEPDLILSGDEREAKYKGESDAERDARMGRYAEAMVEYENQYKDFHLEEQAKVRSFSKDVISSVEDSVTEGEQDDLSALESAISAS